MSSTTPLPHPFADRPLRPVDGPAVTRNTPTAAGTDAGRVQALERLGVSLTEPDPRLDRITRLAQVLFGMPCAAVTLIDENRQWLKSRQGVDVESIRRDEAICDHTIRGAETMVVPDLALDRRFADYPSVTGGAARFYAGHPILTATGVPVGALCVVDVVPRTFGPKQRALRRELALLAQDELTRTAELDHAARVQRELLLGAGPVVDGYDIAALCMPSRAVGGDFVDWYPIPHGGVALTIGDVMGKGVAAAIMMATVRSAIRAHGHDVSPAHAVGRAAASLEGDLDRTGTIVTLLHMNLEPASGVITTCDAGHGLRLLVRSDGSVERPRNSGLPLGVVPGDTWVDDRAVLRPGDTQIAFSDGVLDLYDGTLAALDDIADVVRSSTDVGSIMAHFATMAEGIEPPDDITVAATRRLPG